MTKDTVLKINDARYIAERMDADGVVVLSFRGGFIQGVSYGRTKAKCSTLGAWLDILVDEIEAGTVLPAPTI